MGYPFFTPEPAMVDGSGFDSLEEEHLTALALCLLGIIGFCRAYRATPPSEERWGRRHRMLAILAGAMLAMRLSHDVLCIAAESFSPPWWPLHLCNICELLCLAYVLVPCEPIGLMVFGLALPSGILALVFPGWSYCPMLTWASVCGFAEHAGMVAFSLALLLGGDVAPRPGKVWAPLAFLACYLAIIYPLNHVLDTNFAFVNWPIDDTPLMTLAELFGNPGYLVPYLAIIVTVILGLFWWAERFTRSSKACESSAG